MRATAPPPTALVIWYFRDHRRSTRKRALLGALEPRARPATFNLSIPIAPPDEKSGRTGPIFGRAEARCDWPEATPNKAGRTGDVVKSPFSLEHHGNLLPPQLSSQRRHRVQERGPCLLRIPGELHEGGRRPLRLQKIPDPDHRVEPEGERSRPLRGSSPANSAVPRPRGSAWNFSACPRSATFHGSG